MSYHNLNILTIFPDNLHHNFSYLQSLNSDISPIPVLKSNAYGHGIKIIAPLLSAYRLPFVCVDSLYEAYELEKHWYSGDILIMGYVDPRDVPSKKNFHYAVFDFDYAQALIRKYRKIRLHIFIDTGMHREGFIEINQNNLSAIMKNTIGLMSHLSTPDDSRFTNQQIARFSVIQKILQSIWFSFLYTHIFASGWLLQASWLLHGTTHARVWLAYYGYGHPNLLPALRCTTHIVQIKTLHPGAMVGYDGTYCVSNTMKVAVLPLGYNDGLDRRLSSCWEVTVGGTVCPFIWRISMNVSVIDITKVTHVAVGDEVCFIDEIPGTPNTLEKHAQKCHTIPYDILVHLNKEMYRTRI